MITRILEQADGGQFLIHGDETAVNNISISLSGQASPKVVGEVEMSTTAADTLAQKLVTHEAKFDTMSKKLRFTKRSNKKAG